MRRNAPETGMNQEVIIERMLDLSAKYLGLNRSRCRKCRPALRSTRGAPHTAERSDGGNLLAQRLAG